jgi:ribosomal protein S19E (S16A)
VSRKEENTMENFWKYIKAASIVIGVGVVAYFGYKKIRNMFA